MMDITKIQEGFEVFIADGQKPVGTVRHVSSKHPDQVTIYFENAGDRSVPVGAVKECALGEGHPRSREARQGNPRGDPAQS
jgi:hypothetical protein